MKFSLRIVVVCLLSFWLSTSSFAFIQMNELKSPNEEEYGYFGASVSGCPDVNNDGWGDIIVGAAYESPGASPDSAGRVYVFSGYDGTLLATLASPNEQARGYFGISVSGIPDVNNDGWGDIIIGARGESPGVSPESAGRVYLISGDDGSVLQTLASPNEQVDGIFGCSVSDIPDVDGDGWDDVIVGAPFESPGASPDSAGRAYIFSGDDGTLLHTLESPNEQLGGFFGCSVSGIPDVDGDNRGDAIVGAFWEDVNTLSMAGRAYIFSGDDGTLLRTLESPNAQNQGAFGVSVSGISDVNLDLKGDVIIGANWEDVGPYYTAGRAYIFSGDDGTLLHTLESPNIQVDGQFGCSVSGIPDVSGDSSGDVIIGAYRESPGASPVDAGRAYIFSGDDGKKLWTLASPNAEAYGQFGCSVSGITSVSVDIPIGVIVGANREDPGASPDDAGRAYFSDIPPIPTVSQWGLIVLMLLLVAAGIIFLLSRRRSVAL